MSTPSSIRYNENIENMNDESSSILNLRPVTFNYIKDELHNKQYGLIAEEVYDILPNLVVKNDKGEIETVQYHQFPALLLNELIKQNKMIIDLQQENIELKNQIKNINDTLSKLI